MDEPQENFLHLTLKTQKRFETTTNQIFISLDPASL